MDPKDPENLVEASPDRGSGDFPVCWLQKGTEFPDLESLVAGAVLLLDKPYGVTSFYAVQKIRYHLRKALRIKKLKVGHAGTLDPLASGLLILCIGRMTREIQRFMSMEKEYAGTIYLGASTPSYDLETEVDRLYPTEHLTPKLLNRIAGEMTGRLLQAPPLYSAIRKEGKRLYESARAGEVVEVDKREVEIHRFELCSIAIPEINFRVRCNKGTYIRSLAHDFGQLAGSGAYLSALCRVGIGSYRVEDALSLTEVIHRIKCLAPESR